MERRQEAAKAEERARREREEAERLAALEASRPKEPEPSADRPDAGAVALEERPGTIRLGGKLKFLKENIVKKWK